LLAFFILMATCFHIFWPSSGHLTET